MSAGERGKGVLLGYVYVICQALVMFIYTPLLLGRIGPTEYGLYQLVGSIAAYMNIMESMLTAGVLRFYCKGMAEGDEEGMENTLGLGRFLYRCAAVLMVILGLVAVAVFRVAYATSLAENELDEGCWLLAVLIANIVLNLLNYVTSVVVTANERFTFSKTVDIVMMILQPITVVLVITRFPYAIVIVLAQFTINAIGWIVKRGYVRRTIGAKARIRRFSWSAIKPLLVFSASVSIAMVADIIFAKTDQLIIGLIYGTAPVAVYSIGYTVYAAYQSLGAVVSSVYLPKLSKLSMHENYRELFTDELIRTGRLVLFVLAGILLGFILYGREFIYLWVGDGYEPAYWVAILLMAANFVDILQRVGTVMLQVLDKYTFRAIVYVACALINIPFTVLLTTAFGIIGAAVSSAIVLFAGSGLVVNWYYLKVIGLDIRRFWKEMFLLCGKLAPMLVIGYFIGRICVAGPLLTFLLHSGLFCVAYFIDICLVANSDEKRLIRGIARKA